MFIGTYTPLFTSALSPWLTIGPLFLFMSISVIQEGVADDKHHLEATNSIPCVVLRHSEELESNSEREESILDGEDTTVRLTTTLGSPSSPRRSSARRKRDKDVAVNVTFAKTNRKDILTGEIVLVHNREMIPADIILLGSSGENGNAYVETSSIDGETNLKLPSSPKLPEGAIQEASTRSSIGDWDGYKHPEHENLTKAVKRITRFSMLGYPEGVSALLNPVSAEDEPNSTNLNRNRRSSTSSRLQTVTPSSDLSMKTTTRVIKSSSSPPPNNLASMESSLSSEETHQPPNTSKGHSSSPPTNLTSTLELFLSSDQTNQSKNTMQENALSPTLNKLSMPTSTLPSPHTRHSEEINSSPSSYTLAGESIESELDYSFSSIDTEDEEGGEDEEQQHQQLEQEQEQEQEQDHPQLPRRSQRQRKKTIRFSDEYYQYYK